MVERVRFTEKTAGKLPIPKTGESLVYDTEVPNLALRIRSSGSKSWLLKKGAEKFRLGAVKDVTIAEARVASMKILTDIATGDRPEKKLKPTVRDVLEAYMSDHVASRCKPRTAESYRILLDQHILPRIGDVLSNDLSPRHVDLMLSDMVAIKATANKSLALLNAAFNKALRWGLRDPARGNPCIGAEQHYLPPRETFLTAGELAGLLDALEDLSEQKGKWHAAMCLKILGVTGCRRDEMRLLEESWIDWTGREVHWPDTKTGAGNLILSGVAIDLLKRVAGHRAMRDGMPIMFRGKDTSIVLPHMTLYRVWKHALKRAISHYGVDPRRLAGLRPHDLRHSFASLGLSSGLTLDDVRRLLRHRDASSTARYARHLPQRERELADASEGFLQLTVTTA
jgi:integrase